MATMKVNIFTWTFPCNNIASAVNQAKARYERLGLIGRMYVTFGETTVQVNM